MYVHDADFRPSSLLQLRAPGLLSMLGGVLSVGFIYGLIPTVILAMTAALVSAGILAPSEIADEPPPPQEPEIIQAGFVELGRAWDPRELPDRAIRSNVQANRRQDPDLVSQNTRPRTVWDGGVPPRTGLEALTDRAAMYDQSGEAQRLYEQAGDEGGEVGRAQSGNMLLGHIQALFRRGLTIPSSVPESSWSSLSTRVSVVITSDLRIESARISNPSGFPAYDAAVQRRIDEILSSGVRLDPPSNPADLGIVGRPLSVNVVPPGQSRRATSRSTGNSALDRLGAGYSTGD